MLENISRMFSSNDPDAAEESDAPVDGDDPTGETPVADSAAGHPNKGDALTGTAPSDSDDGDAGQEPDVAELDVRLDELDDELSSTDASIRELRSAQEEMAESVEGVNDTVRQLVGIYDRLAAEENPFIEEPNSPRTDTGPPIPGADGGGEPPTREKYWGDEKLSWGGEESSPSPTADDGGDEVVSFDDLENMTDKLVEDPTPRPDGEPPAGVAGVDDCSPSSRPASDEREAVLETVPDGYAGEVLVMEWLATLIDKSGPAGAFRAVDYYENVGWISPAVERRLVDVIGGPALDVFVDPTQPREPTAEEHAVSHEYLRVLARLNDI